MVITDWGMIQKAKYWLCFWFICGNRKKSDKSTNKRGIGKEESAKGWTKEVNLISWNGAAPKYDIRDWAPEHEKMGKGITLTKEEVQELYKILAKIVSDEG